MNPANFKLKFHGFKMTKSVGKDLVTCFTSVVRFSWLYHGKNHCLSCQI